MPPVKNTKGDYELLKRLRPLKRVLEDIQGQACECVQVDVDEWDARFCPQHGQNSIVFRRQMEREAADLVAYYSGPDPFEESLCSSAAQQSAAEERKHNARTTLKGDRKMKE